MNQKEKSKKLEIYWKKHVLAFESSNSSCTAYCLEHKLNVHQLSYWRKRIKQLSEKSEKKVYFSKVKLAPKPESRSHSLKLSLSMPNGVVAALELKNREDFLKIINDLAKS